MNAFYVFTAVSTMRNADVMQIKTEYMHSPIKLFIKLYMAGNNGLM